LSKDQKCDLEILGGPLFTKVRELFDSNTIYSKLDKSTSRRLIHFPDKEGKVRVIAILDYFTQNVLFGIHNYCFNALKRIKQDCTFDQGSFKRKLDFSKKELNSIDLTAATDRFPISLEEKLLQYRFGKPYATAWSRTMIGTPFTYKDEIINYSVGNPMGAYSS